MKKISIALYVSLFFTTFINAQIKILFDATKAETAANADWQIDADLFNVSFGSGNPNTNGSGTEANPQRYPSPSQSNIDSLTPESYWKGGLSSWGIECVKKGYQVETLPIGGSITYGNSSNPQDLSNYTVFVVDEPNILFTTNEKNAILQFVQNGGGLMIIADHDMSDRNFDGYDSPTIWNTMMGNGNPFGFYFNLEDFSQSTTNIPNLPNDSLLNGVFGTVSKVQFNGGTSMTLTPSTNSTVKGIVYKTGSSFGNSNVMVAYSRYGLGKVVAIGDSSPEDDGTGDDNDVLYDGWLGNATGNHRKLVMNATVWLATKPFSIELTKSDCNCFGSNNGTASVVPKGGSGIYSYKWSNGKTTSSISNLKSGIYTVTVNGGSSLVGSVTITEPTDITINEQIQNITCKNKIGQIETFVTGGTQNYVFKWSNNNQTNKLIVSQGGFYTLTVTDNNGCMKSKQYEITVDTLIPNVEILGDSVINCLKSQIELIGNSSTQGVSYHWFGNGINENSKSIIVQNKGQYSLQITNPINSCVGTKIIEIKQDTIKPQIIIEGNSIISCSNSTISLKGMSDVSGLIYEWVGKGIASNQSEIIVMDSGLVELKVMNPQNGCKNAAQKTIEKNTTIPSISIEGNSIINCSNSTILLKGISDVSGLSYEWVGIGIASNQSEIIVTDSGLVELKVTNPQNGCKNMAQKIIEKNTTIPSISIEGNSIINCSNSIVLLKGISDVSVLSYEWVEKGIVSNQSEIIVTDSGLIELKVTNPQNGCKNAVQKTIEKNTSIPSISIEGNSIINCSKPTVLLKGISDVSGLSYEWVGIGIASNQSEIIVTDSGLIELKVTNPQNGCKNTAQKIIEKNVQLPERGILGEDTLTCYRKEIDLVAKAQNKTYEWRRMDSVLSIKNSLLIHEIGNYQLKVTDTLNGCFIIDSISIVYDDNHPEISSFIIKDETNNLTNGSLFIEILGGKKPYSFQWKDSTGMIISTAQNLENVSNGKYQVIVTDNNGCSTFKFFTLSNIITLINDLNNEDIEIFPNPTSRILNFVLKNRDEILSISIYNENGQLLKSQYIINGNSIDLDEFQNGLFYLSIKTQKMLYWKKLILIK